MPNMVMSVSRACYVTHMANNASKGSADGFCVVEWVGQYELPYIDGMWDVASYDEAVAMAGKFDAAQVVNADGVVILSTGWLAD